MRWLAALTLGADQRLETQDWELLNASGTTHLVVISGLHIGLVAAFALGVSRLLARCLVPGGWRMAIWPGGARAWPLPAMRCWQDWKHRHCVPDHDPGRALGGQRSPCAGYLAGMVAGTGAGPAARSLVRLAPRVVAFLYCRGAVDPDLAGTRETEGRAWLVPGLVRTQCLLAPVMAAAVLLAFGRLAPAAPLINLVAVPLVSSLMVPLGLLAGCWPGYRRSRRPAGVCLRT